MTAFDSEFKKYPNALEKQNIVMTIHFRPDETPKDRVEWLERLANIARHTAKLTKQGILPNKLTKDFEFKEVV